ncbi:hypothetical protein VQ03_00130 [Methylobacterium tarhaniae]|uniref:RTX toxin-activating lysine-acyltransferase n=1 Tax=Methylobacterium tarhaniae TaxID=1187852 RepID=A0A0J6TGX6_9HYPH|nr:toxin-activating lysine-acyltransferase [Methylobacterium tarhaniae]KMO44978.1 hypothetical protein VQ03_00130 [Methylobacterium tarhaniae]
MSDHASPHAVPDGSEKTIATVFGEIVWLMSRSSAHRSIPVGDLEHLVMAPILLRQIRVFYDGDQPAAAVLYARVSEAVAARLEAGATTAELSLDDWHSGDTVRVMQVIAPLGGAEIYAHETLAVLGDAPAPH